MPKETCVVVLGPAASPCISLEKAAEHLHLGRLRVGAAPWVRGMGTSREWGCPGIYLQATHWLLVGVGDFQVSPQS